MWSSKVVRRGVFATAVLALSAIVSGCTFTPVYSGASQAQSQLNLAFAKPTTRLEQVVYQELALRFGSNDAATAPLATVVVSSTASDLALSTTGNPSKPMRVVVTATLTVTARDGSAAPPQVFTRQAAADYTRNGQVLADRAAAEEAAERAARSAAESLRLAVLAALSRG